MVLNGNGEAGAAHAAADRVQAHGYLLGDVGNAPSEHAAHAGHVPPRLRRRGTAARARPARAASCVRSTGCAPRSCSARTSCSSWARRRVDRAARAVEIAAGLPSLPEEEVVERVRVVEVAVRGARLLEHVQLEGAELDTTCPGSSARGRAPAGVVACRPVERAEQPERLDGERVEGVRRFRLVARARRGCRSTTASSAAL